MLLSCSLNDGLDHNRSLMFLFLVVLQLALVVEPVALFEVEPGVELVALFGVEPGIELAVLILVEFEFELALVVKLVIGMSLAAAGEN